MVVNTVTLPTVEQVKESTGVDVTDAQIANAWGIISTLTGVDLTIEVPLLARDARALRTAVVWQAPYLKANPGLTDQPGNLTSASTNGVAVAYSADQGSAGAILAPLARAALKRLSWRGIRVVRMRPAEYRDHPVQTIVEDGRESDWRRL